MCVKGTVGWEVPPIALGRPPGDLGADRRDGSSDGEGGGGFGSEVERGADGVVGIQLI